MRHSATLEWEFLEDDEEEWQYVLATRPVDDVLAANIRRQLLAIAGVAVCAAIALSVLICYRLWNEAQQGIALIEKDAQTIVKFETLRHDAQAPDGHVTSTVDSVDINASGIMVRVVVTETDAQGSIGTSTESRFYTRSGAGWQPSAPLPSFWGSEMAFESGNLHVIFRARDHAAVADAAVPMARCLSSLRTQLGLPPLGSAERITLTVVPTAVLSGWATPDGAILLSSPLVLRIPATGTGASVLLTQAYPALLAHTMTAVLATADVSPEWLPVVLDLYWWLQQNPQAVPACMPDLVASAAALETTCVSTGGVMLLTIDTAYVSPNCAGCSSHLTNVVANNKNVFFASLTAGETQATVPKFLAALRGHTSWSTLVPDVFGMSRAELQHVLQCPA